MNINRNNYEEFFMLYADSELNAAETMEVETFIAANPDLKPELEMFYQFKTIPDTNVVFADKASLLRQADRSSRIAIENYEAYFILYGDNELSNDEKTAVESFVYRNPSLQAEFELLQQSRLTADTSIVIAGKQTLYRYEKDDKVIPFRWWRIAAAAAILLLATGLVWMNSNSTVDRRVAISSKPVLPAKQPSLPVIVKVAPAKPDGRENAIEPAVAAADRPVLKDRVEKDSKLVKTFLINGPAKIKTSASNIPDQANVLPTDVVATITDKPIRSTTIDAIKHTPAADIKRPLMATAKPPIVDQPAIILNPDENKTQVEYASFNTDNVEVLNTTVNTKNALRGFLRKASRLIAKKTNTDDEDGKRKGILIGGFEIAVR